MTSVDDAASAASLTPYAHGSNVAPGSVTVIGVIRATSDCPDVVEISMATVCEGAMAAVGVFLTPGVT